MDARQELEELRRLDELERKARGTDDLVQKAKAAGVSMRDGKVNWDVELQKQDIREQSLPGKLFRAMGAGFADYPLAIKQILNKDPERAKQLEQEAENKREVDRFLSKQTDLGMLPDQVLGVDTPTLGGTAQMHGKIAPTMMLPAARLAGLKGVASNFGVGAGLSALEPTVEGESRAGNMGMGGVLSAALPMTMSVISPVWNMVSRSGGRKKAAEEVSKAVSQGQDESSVLRQTIDRLRNAQQQPGAIPLSTAAQLRDAELARLEAGSRARNGANWYDFDQNQARAVASEFDRATAEASDLVNRRTQRASNWENRWNAAQQNLQPDFQVDLPTFRANLDVAKMSPEASNPAVLNMLNAITGEIDRVGPNFNVGHLQQIRANLSARYNPMNPNAFAGAPRDSAARISTMQQIDDILNRATGGKWQNVVSGYEADSRLVDAAKAAGRARQTYYDPATGRVLGVSADAAGDIPKITEAGLGRAMNAARGPGGSLLMSAQANERLNAILEALRAQNIVQGVKRSATAGGGSNTASDMLASKSAGAAADAMTSVVGGPAATVGKGVWDGLKSYATANKDRALAEALQNPQQMIQLLETKLAAGAPMSAQEHYLLSLLRGAPAAATGN